MTASNNRTQLLEHLRHAEPWDVLVIGGGASGLGTAVEAATRGYRTLLVEAHDFAKGTSSRSTKLVHGGVRYLAQGNVGLVREALRERGLLRQNAPHLVHDMSFVVPAYDWWAGPFYGVGLKLYDVLAGRLSLGTSRYLNKPQALELAPTLQAQGLRGGILYHDGQFDDARLAITLMRTLFDQGGTGLNHAPVTGLIKEGGKVAGATVRDAESGEEFAVRARAVVNATGVWVDNIRRMDQPDTTPMLSPSQGVHLVLGKKFLPGASAIMIPRTDDGRVLFAVPWHDRVVLGTTDTPVPDASLEPRALGDEVEFILRTAARYMDPVPHYEDILSIYAGLRPLVKADSEGASTARLSRDHVLRTAPSGLITLTGGKWTTYRKMGEDAVNCAAQVAALPPRLSLTQGLHLHGWTEQPEEGPLGVYGSDAPQIRSLEGAGTLLHPALPYDEAQVRYAVRFELARGVEDVLARRTRALLLDARASLEAAPRVAQILAAELRLDAGWVEAQVAQYASLVEGYLPEIQQPGPAGQPRAGGAVSAGLD